jgi:hypothetical protein
MAFQKDTTEAREAIIALAQAVENHVKGGSDAETQSLVLKAKLLADKIDRKAGYVSPFNLEAEADEEGVVS